MSESVISISVIIPSFNVQDYISEAIESVLYQSAPPNEIIIINDGSTDDTRSVISQYECHDIVKVIDTENRGLGPARNTGLEMASSDYVYFFDSDDIMDEQFIKKITCYIEKNERPEMVVFSGESFCDDPEEISFKPPGYRRKIEGCFNSGSDLYRALFEGKSIFSSACLYITKKDVWERSGLKFKPIVHEDEDILLPLFLSVQKSCALREVFFYRRVRAGSIMTGGVTARNARGMLQVIKTLLALKEAQPQLVNENYDLWLFRTQSMLVAAFARSIQSGKLVPDPLVVRTLCQVWTLRTIFSISMQYALAFKKRFLRFIT
ncbi:MAG: glycosyltransferase family A protein [Thalassolituus sp.]|jgi:glycosyltransferase involved in cell wall biosynthesis|tara:strand:- start:5613 stop:6575 length:963 start_codon:yes stop_codon:yes gene_type:complete